MDVGKINNKHSMERTMTEAGGKLLVIAFISYRCGYCKKWLPILEKLGREMSGVIFKIVDVNAANELAMEFGIESVPLTFVYKNGVMCHRIAGADQDSLVNSLQSLGN